MGFCIAFWAGMTNWLLDTPEEHSVGIVTYMDSTREGSHYMLRVLHTILS